MLFQASYDIIRKTLGSEIELIDSLIRGCKHRRSIALTKKEWRYWNKAVERNKNRRDKLVAALRDMKSLKNTLGQPAGSYKL